MKVYWRDQTDLHENQVKNRVETWQDKYYMAVHLKIILAMVKSTKVE